MPSSLARVWSSFTRSFGWVTFRVPDTPVNMGSRFSSAMKSDMTSARAFRSAPLRASSWASKPARMPSPRMGGGTKASTVASLIPPKRCETRATRASAECSGPIRSDQSFRLTNMLAAEGTAALERRSCPHMAVIPRTSGCASKNSSIRATTALVRSSDAPCGSCATIMR